MKNFLRRMLGLAMRLLLRWRSQPYPFPAGAAVIVAPHADDETLGCGGLLAAKSVRGDTVHVVFFSDSAGSPESFPLAGQAALRRREALAALAVLGVLANQVDFLDAPDGRLNRLSDGETAHVDAAFASLLQQFKPAEIFVPYLGGGSSEHDATVDRTRTALALSGVPARVWEYPVWAWWDARRLARQLSCPAQNFHLTLGALRTRKCQALACHRSQLTASPGTGEPDLPPVLAALCTGPTEFFFYWPA